MGDTGTVLLILLVVVGVVVGVAAALREPAPDRRPPRRSGHAEVAGLLDELRRAAVAGGWPAAGSARFALARRELEASLRRHPEVLAAAEPLRAARRAAALLIAVDRLLEKRRLHTTRLAERPRDERWLARSTRRLTARARVIEAQAAFLGRVIRYGRHRPARPGAAAAARLPIWDPVEGDGRVAPEDGLQLLGEAPAVRPAERGAATPAR